MEFWQAAVYLATFACAFGGLLIAMRVERRISKMFGKGNLKEALWQFFSNVPDDEGKPVPPQAAFFAFCNGIALNVTDYAIEQMPGALASFGGSTAAKKAAKSSAFARGAQNLSEGGFGELAGVKEMAMDFMGKVGTGGEKGDWMSQLGPIFIEKMMNQGGGNGPPQSYSQPQMGAYHSGGKLGGG